MYIVVEGEDPGFDIFVNGRTLARNEERWRSWRNGSE